MFPVGAASMSRAQASRTHRVVASGGKPWRRPSPPAGARCPRRDHARSMEPGWSIGISRARPNAARARVSSPAMAKDPPGRATSPQRRRASAQAVDLAEAGLPRGSENGRSGRRSASRRALKASRGVQPVELAGGPKLGSTSICSRVRASARCTLPSFPSDASRLPSGVKATVRP